MRYLEFELLSNPGDEPKPMETEDFLVGQRVRAVQYGKFVLDGMDYGVVERVSERFVKVKFDKPLRYPTGGTTVEEHLLMRPDELQIIDPGLRVGDRVKVISPQFGLWLGKTGVLNTAFHPYYWRVVPDDPDLDVILVYGREVVKV